VNLAELQAEIAALPEHVSQTRFNSSNETTRADAYMCKLDAVRARLDLVLRVVREYDEAYTAVLAYTDKYLESGGTPLTMPKRWHQLDEIRQEKLANLRLVHEKLKEGP